MTLKRMAVAAAAWCVAMGVATAQTRPMQPDKDGYVPDLSIAEIMESIVMPAAQALWDAVGVDVTAQGEVEKKPETDEQWAALRAAAVTLAEATNSLTVPGHHAAPPGAAAANDSELAPEAIEALLAQQRPAWVAQR